MGAAGGDVCDDEERRKNMAKDKLISAANDACGVLAQIAHDDSVKSGDRIRAAEILIERGYGKNDGTAQVVFVGEEKI
ncbi:MAG: hypothetical protein IJT07_02670 [Oscillospiraceae bacterium]|nr:hypothetical protein [Oscillospiraceae bacterium]